MAEIALTSAGGYAGVKMSTAFELGTFCLGTRVLIVLNNLRRGFPDAHPSRCAVLLDTLSGRAPMKLSC